MLKSSSNWLTVSLSRLAVSSEEIPYAPPVLAACSKALADVLLLRGTVKEPPVPTLPRPDPEEVVEVEPSPKILPPLSFFLTSRRFMCRPCQSNRTKLVFILAKHVRQSSSHRGKISRIVGTS